MKIYPESPAWRWLSKMNAKALFVLGAGATALIASHAVALDLVREGKAVATIVIPNEPSASEQKAAGTLARYLKLASGADLPIVKEVASATGAVISIGRTEMAAKAGLSAKDLEYDGYHLRVKNGALYLLGRDDAPNPNISEHIGAKGSWRAALGLLEQLGFRWLQPTEQGVHVPELNRASVPDSLNVTFRPPFMYANGRMDQYGDWSLANNFRTAIRIFTMGGHTWVTFVPASLWDTHPEYFHEQGGKRIKPTGDGYFVCPSNPDVIGLLTEGVRKKFAEGYELVQLGQSDGYEPCECARCKALDKPGQFHEQVHYAHYRVIQALAKTNPDQKVHLLIYGPTMTPSAKIDKYPANTILELCGGEYNVWMPKAPSGSTVYAYYMGEYHDTGLAPRCTPKRIAEEIQKLHRLDVKGIYFCGGGYNCGLEGPTHYIAGRMMGNPSQSWQALLQEYCDLLFGKAGKAMRSYYDLLYEQIDGGGLALGNSSDMFTATYPPRVQEQLSGFLELAKMQAVGDVRATGWLRLVELQHRHVTLIARAYQLYKAYETNRTLDNLKQVRDAVAAYKTFADELVALSTTAPQFVRDYFPAHARWQDVASNAGHLGAPFTWNLDALIQAKVLPGKDRTRGVIPKLASAPAIDGNLDDGAWSNVAWNEIGGVSLGELSAKTRFRMGYDDVSLYFAFECSEPLIEEMVVKENAHDGPVWRTECIELLFDPEANGTKMMHLIAAPSKDARYDGRLGSIDDPFHPLVLQKREDVSWNPEWSSAFQVRKSQKLWTMELAIPFASLGVARPASGERWRVNFGRERHMEKTKGKRLELSLWSPNFQEASFTDPTVFGDLFFDKVMEGK